MGTKTGIAWCDHTFNPWWGCTKVSPGCDNCYASLLGQRFGTTWGHGEQRRFFDDRHWNEPLKWNRHAQHHGLQRRVFCASMADVFDNEVAQEHRERIWITIRETPHLDWLLLTKRVGNVSTMLPADWGAGYSNVWLGISVVNQEEVDRDIPKLVAIPARIRFLSCEPLLSAITLAPWLNKAGLHWVIVGGESGPRARPMHLQWVRDLVAQCDGAGVACFVKQLGAHLTDDDPASIALTAGSRRHQKKGDVPDEWPPDLRVRVFPPLNGAGTCC